MSRASTTYGLLVLGFIILRGTPSSSLEKHLSPWSGEGAQEWNASGTCTVQYFNVCNGWMWVWSDFHDEDIVGVAVDACCDAAHLESAWVFAEIATPTYAFTGVIEVFEADTNRCPTGPALGQNWFLPQSGWNRYVFNCDVPHNFVILATLANDAGDYAIPMFLSSDAPSTDCGTCYPENRIPHTFLYGKASNPLCPGIQLGDASCGTEFMWYATLECSVHVEGSTWGAIKNLYK